MFLNFVENAIIDDEMDDIFDVVGFVGVVGNDVVQRGFGAQIVVVLLGLKGGSSMLLEGR